MDFQFSTNNGIGLFIIEIVGFIVLIKLFQNGGFLKGLIGLITCNIYTFIWGWMNIGREELKLKTLMYIWTGAFVLGFIVTMMGGSGGEEESFRLLFSFM